MAASYMQVKDLRVGLPVEYLGKPDPDAVLSDRLRAVGLVLYCGPPGRVWSTTLQHAQMTWVGLEDEPASYAVGFSLPSEEESFYPVLGLLTEEEFTRRERAGRTALVADLIAGRRLSPDPLGALRPTE